MSFPACLFPRWISHCFVMFYKCSPWILICRNPYFHLKKTFLTTTISFFCTLAGVSKHSFPFINLLPWMGTIDQDNYHNRKVRNKIVNVEMVPIFDNRPSKHRTQGISVMNLSLLLCHRVQVLGFRSRLVVTIWVIPLCGMTTPRGLSISKMCYLQKWTLEAQRV